MEKEVLEYLNKLKDDTFKNFQKKLISTNSEILGVKMNYLKDLAKTIVANNQTLELLPYGKYYEYDILNGLMISYQKITTKEKLNNLLDFSYHIDNWSMCDTTVCSTKFKKQDYDLLFTFCEALIKSDKPFVNRFGVIFMLKYFSGIDSEMAYNLLSTLTYGNYYLDMGVAWFYSVALIRNFRDTLKSIIKIRSKSEFVYQKSLQKAIESYRITDEQKVILRNLKKVEKGCEDNVKF